MGWLWPWRSDPSSPASFEKTLSALSEKITKSQAHLDVLRSRGRRVRGLTTLYLMLAYLLYGIVALLVIGQQNMGPMEWTGLAGGPVAIYTTRQLVAAFFNWRIDSAMAKLQAQQEERAKTIQKLKDATRYNSTLELIEKYGGTPGTGLANDDRINGPASRQNHGRPVSQYPNQPPQQRRTGIAPPPTANIQRQPGTPNIRACTPDETGAEFAPNAELTPEQASDAKNGAPRLAGQDPSSGFSRPQPPLGSGPAPQPSMQPSGPQFKQYEDSGPRWYDRFLDLLLGEDEMAPRNRIVLICGNCRLVNGQAPPGTKGLAEIGRWKCIDCGALNGEVDEGKKILQELMEEKKGSPIKQANDKDDGSYSGVKAEQGSDSPGPEEDT